MANGRASKIRCTFSSQGTPRLFSFKAESLDQFVHCVEEVTNMPVRDWCTGVCSGWTGPSVVRACGSVLKWEEIRLLLLCV